MSDNNKRMVTCESRLHDKMLNLEFRDLNFPHVVRITFDVQSIYDNPEGLISVYDIVDQLDELIEHTLAGAMTSILEQEEEDE